MMIQKDLKTEYLKFLCDELDFIIECPSLLVVSAHPDDEIIGLGAQIPRLRNITFLHTTDGAPINMKEASLHGFSSRKDYAQKRYHEFCNALSAAGISMPSCIELGYIDQESSFHLVKLSKDLAEIFNALKPDVVITHPYEGGHPDHDACAFAVQSACLMSKKQKADHIPLLLEFSSYHSDNGRMTTFEFLPDNTCLYGMTEITGDKLKLKEKLMSCFETQNNVLKYFPLNIECFRDAPHYNFLSSPHEGKLYYEYFDWGMTGPLWRRLSKEAIWGLNL